MFSIAVEHTRARLRQGRPPSAQRTASCPAIASATAPASPVRPATTSSPAAAGTIAASRANAVTRWPAASAIATRWRPVPPVGPKTMIRIARREAWLDQAPRPRDAEREAQ